jgi:vitamin B12 transporter
LLLVATAADQEIVVTASREPVGREDSGGSSTVIGGDTIERLGFALTGDLLRLVPGVAVAAAGPAGTQTQVRIRGAEANHSLLFVDGIRFNDPAAGNEARFELLTNDGLSRIELVRGPQSALWGSEALGGVVAVSSPDPVSTSAAARGEYGGLDTIRTSGRFGYSAGPIGIGGAAGRLRSDGIDAHGGGGDHDGFDNRFASLKTTFRPSERTEIGLVGHWVEGHSEFDGFDPVTFRRADTLDETTNRIAAGRAWVKIGWGSRPDWTLRLGASLLDSSNRNRLGEVPLNRTSGQRATFDGQVSARFPALGADQRLTVAASHEHEEFQARDQGFFGAADQDRVRNLTALAGEWRADWGPVVADVSLRRDAFSAFGDATTLRASLLGRLGQGWTVHAAYGEGIAQPTFYDLFGFLPGSFVGNPDLKPESSTGWEAGIAWSDDRTRVAVTGFAARLHDEIVEASDPVTFLPTVENAARTSRRRGIEIEAERRLGPLNLTLAYTFLDAEERAPGHAPREIRRPRHSATLAGTGNVGPLRIGASLAWIGKRQDSDFDFFPAPRVTLGSYVLGSLDVAWPIGDRFELYARMENAFDADYQDVVGYATAGRTVHAGLRLHFGS